MAQRVPIDEKPQDVPDGRVSVAKPTTTDATSLTADAVLVRINSTFMSNIKRCYKDYLAKEPSAAGRIVLTLPISAGGKVVGGNASGLAKEVDTCITDLMASWSFPPPKDSAGAAVAAKFQVTLQLVTE